MDEDIMGKGFDQHKVALGIIIGVVLVLSAAHGFAQTAHTEYELLNQGYSYYLSYMPQQAVESLNLFLKTFPESSARDAALFWMGKALFSLGSVDEAGRYFSEIKQKHRESPFIAYTEKEIAALAMQGSFREARIRDTGEKEGRLPVAMPGTQSEEKMTPLEEKTARSAEKTVQSSVVSADERKQPVALRATADTSPVRERELQELIERLEREQKTEVQHPEEVKTTTIAIMGTRYSAQSILEFMLHSITAITKLGVRTIPWRTGNIHEDFITEHILFEESKRQHITRDEHEERVLTERHALAGDEKSYLSYYLLISNLVDLKVKELPEEKVAETVHIPFSVDDRYDKAYVAAQLQTAAVGGVSLEAISREHAGITRYSVARLSELQQWQQEKIGSLQPNESRVLSLDHEYILVKIATRPLTYRPLEHMEKEQEMTIRFFIKRWIETLRRTTYIVAIERGG